MGRPRFVATEDQRKTVKAMVAYGIPQVEIAKIVGCGESTLSQAFREEIDTATAEANAKVAQTLFRMATSGENVAATIFWLKTRAKWRETNHHEHDVNFNLDKTTTEDIESELASLRRRARIAAGTRAVETDMPDRPDGLLN